jgi:hypothetical protein
LDLNRPKIHLVALSLDFEFSRYSKGTDCTTPKIPLPNGSSFSFLIAARQQMRKGERDTSLIEKSVVKQLPIGKFYFNHSCDEIISDVAVFARMPAQISSIHLCLNCVAKD